MALIPIDDRHDILRLHWRDSRAEPLCSFVYLYRRQFRLAGRHPDHPGVASSPFVATFVDVTRIVIYFNVAEIYLM